MATLIKRIAQFAKIGLGMGGVLSIYAAVLYVLGDHSVFERNHTTVLRTIAAYLSGGVLVGSVVGLLQPLTRRRIGAAAVGCIAAFPFMLMLAALDTGTGPQVASNPVFATLGSVLLDSLWPRRSPHFYSAKSETPK